MTLTARATSARWLGGGDVDLAIRVRNTSMRPTRVRFIAGLARMDADLLGSTELEGSMEADSAGNPEDREYGCVDHWLPWRSSATHAFRFFHVFRVPASMLVIVEAEGERAVLDVDLSAMTGA